MSTTNPTSFNKRLGAAVRARRIELGLSQQAVGDVPGVTFQQQQKYERGVNRLSTETLVQIAKFLNTTPQTLIDAAIDEETAVEEPRDAMGDRMRLETVRCLGVLPADRQRIVRNVIKALAGEEVA